MSNRRVFAVLAVVFSVAAALLFAFGKSTRLEIGIELHNSINICIAAKAGSGLEGHPVASSEIISARKTADGAVAYLWAVVQGYGGTSDQPKLLWSSREACRVVLKTDSESGELEPDYCMLPRDGENYDSDLKLMFSPLTRLMLGRAEKSQELSSLFENRNYSAAVDFLAESEKISEYSVSLVEAGGDISLEPLSLMKIRGSLILTAAITNKTDGFVCYGSDFTLERISDDISAELSVREGYTFNKGMSVLDKGQYSDRMFMLNAYFDDIEPGTYRLTAFFNPGTQETEGEKMKAYMVFNVNK